MKTTIELPDETLKRAKVYAAEHGTSLKEVVASALDSFIESATGNNIESRKKELRKLLVKMQASNTTPMKPLSREEANAR